MSNIIHVFVSSTWLDLKPERQAAEAALQRMRETKLVGMEYFGSREDTTRDVSLAEVNRSHFYIGIFGGRYGSGITEDEYRRAREKGLPCCIYFKVESTIAEDQREKDPAKIDKLKALKAELRRHHTVTEFTNTDNLAWKVTADLHDWLVETRRATRSGLIPVDITGIDNYAPKRLIGREDKTQRLNDHWGKVQRQEKGRPHIVTFVAIGGEGKTALVAKWAAEMAHQDWPGCDAAFAWSFSNQGTREQLAASSDLFLKAALTFFGDEADKAFAASNAGAFDKGRRLAQLVGERRALLILDGLEPLQYPSSSTAFTPGQLKDEGVAKLLKDLAATSQGLCIVTTRIGLPDLKAFKDKTVLEEELKSLSREAGVDLLQKLDVKGSLRRNVPFNDGKELVNEFEKLVEEVKGHALTLTLLGGFLKRAFHGDIRQRDRMKFEKADEKMDGGHAFRTMAAYEQWLLRDGGDEGRREVAVLQLMGLFDRPADAGCLAALRSETIPGLTEPLAGLADDDWEYCLSGLEAAKLLTVNRDASGALVSLDAHPLLREYFAQQLRGKQPEAWRAAHRRLYEHLYASTPDKPQPTLEDLQPLYQAVAHGCQAGLQQEACQKVYIARLLRGNDHYSWKTLGAFGSDLGALACFFDSPWKLVSPLVKEADQAFLLNQTFLCLRALGRLTEALEPMRAAMNWAVSTKDWGHAAVGASNLSELELTLGEVAGAVGESSRSVTYADLGGDAGWRITSRTTHADALHQAGLPRRSDAKADRPFDAKTRFHEAEQMQREMQHEYPLLYSLRGFQYCDLLLAAPERAAWQLTLSLNSQQLTINSAVSDCCAVSQRAVQIQKRSTGRPTYSLLDIALDYLTLGRAALYKVILESGSGILPLKSDEKQRLEAAATFATARRELDAAVSGLRRAGDVTRVPRALLARAWLGFLTGACTGADSAQEDLDEAWEIAERGPMKLFLADIHLYRARLFFREEKYPWKEAKNRKGEFVTNRTPKDDLDDAEYLINTCGYHRRDEELADAKKALDQ